MRDRRRGLHDEGRRAGGLIYPHQGAGTLRTSAANHVVDLRHVVVGGGDRPVRIASAEPRVQVRRVPVPPACGSFSLLYGVVLVGRAHAQPRVTFATTIKRR